MVHKLCRDDTVAGMVCFVCAQVHTHVSCWNRMWKPPVFVGTAAEIQAQETDWRNDPCNKYNSYSHGKIRMVRVRDAFFASMIPRSDSEKDQRKAENARKYYNVNMLRNKFMERFANPANDTDAPWQHSDILDADNSEWQRTLKTKKPFQRIDRVMCCPEDARPCSTCKKNEDQLCEECEIPMCHECEIACRFSPHVIPMGLSNDLFSGMLHLSLRNTKCVGWKLR